MATHNLKTWPEFFMAVKDEFKTFEVRKKDRDFQLGDKLRLEEFIPDVDKLGGHWTGRNITVEVCYMLEGGQFGIETGYCVMGIKLLEDNK